MNAPVNVEPDGEGLEATPENVWLRQTGLSESPTNVMHKRTTRRFCLSLHVCLCLSVCRVVCLSVCRAVCLSFILIIILFFLWDKSFANVFF